MKKPTSKSRPMPKQRRKERPRPTPRWLTGRSDLDQVAQRRCLLLLSVLSGETPVTKAITDMQVSRGFYYQLETRALLAMLQALAPGADTSSNPDDATPARKIAALESQVAKLEQDKRRVERLLFLTRKILPTGPITTGRGRPPKSRTPSSTTTGRRASPTPRRTTASPGRPENSIQTASGEGER